MKNKDKILISVIDSIKLKDVAQIIDNLDSICASGTKIYISAGNKGDKSLNLYTLADSVRSVGALNNKGKKASFSCDNSLVNRWENDKLEIHRTKDGYDILGNGKTDVTFSQTGSYIRIPSFFNIRGTSFASPKALVKDLKE